MRIRTVVSSIVACLILALSCWGDTKSSVPSNYQGTWRMVRQSFDMGPTIDKTADAFKEELLVLSESSFFELSIDRKTKTANLKGGSVGLSDSTKSEESFFFDYEFASNPQLISKEGERHYGRLSFKDGELEVHWYVWLKNAPLEPMERVEYFVPANS